MQDPGGIQIMLTVTVVAGSETVKLLSDPGELEADGALAIMVAVQ